MEKTWSRKGRGGGWLNESPDLGSHFQSYSSPSPPTPRAVLSQQSCKNLKGALLFSRFTAKPVHTLEPLGPMIPRAGRGAKGKERRVLQDHQPPPPRPPARGCDCARFSPAGAAPRERERPGVAWRKPLGGFPGLTPTSRSQGMKRG